MDLDHSNTGIVGSGHVAWGYVSGFSYPVEIYRKDLLPPPLSEILLNFERIIEESNGPDDRL